MKLTLSRPLAIYYIMIAFTLFGCGLIELALPRETAEPPIPTDVPLQPTALPVPTEGVEPTQDQSQSDNRSDQDNKSANELLVEMIMVNGYQDRFGTWNVVGLVRNTSNQNLYNIEVEIELFDSVDNSLFVTTDFIDLYNLAPGETSPFSYTVYEELPNVNNFLARIVGFNTTNLDRVQPEFLNTRLTYDEDGEIHLTGELFNTTDRPIIINSLAGATFDQNGAIQTANSYNVSVRYLEPEDVGPFRITIYGGGIDETEIGSFELFVDAEFTDPITPSGLTISEAYNYVDSFGLFHLAGEVTNNTALTLSISMLAGIYDDAGTVLDAAELSLPVSGIAPGDTIPFDFSFWEPLNSDQELLDKATSYSIAVDEYWTWEASYELVDLATQNDDNTFDSYGGEFTGQVVNNSGKTVDFVSVIIYLRDTATGQVIASNYDFMFETLTDGGVTDYIVLIDVPSDFNIDTAQYYIIAKGEVAE